ncbi:putative transmembrane protein 244 isoform X1 [Paroedura picta]|uniref:putative transmembrane protein 244 isoform X1 n=2 Tax=Paroedura picta TaxID=143630 RepID=UPI0040570F6C
MLPSHGFQESRAAAIKTIVLQILLCLFIFYAIYYMIGSVFCGLFRLNSFDAHLPFDFKTEPSYWNPNYLVNIISMEITFSSSGLFFAVLLKRWVWDYALTVTSIHLLLTWAVMEEFPLVWHWWLALASGLFLMICNGEVITYFAYPESSSPDWDNYF